jgi:hypothetical protein
MHDCLVKFISGLLLSMSMLYRNMIMHEIWNEYFELKNVRCLFYNDKKNNVDMQSCIKVYNKILKDVI